MQDRVDFLNKAYEKLGKEKVEEIIVDGLLQCSHIMSPEDFWPDSPVYGHLGRELTEEEKSVFADYHRAYNNFHAEWIDKNLHRLNQEQIVKTMAFHPEDVGEIWSMIEDAILS